MVATELPQALRLDQQPTWHTYWITAGTGYPTKLEWSLPTGWTAGDIQWPAPVMIKNEQGEVTGNGYTGVVYLPVTVTPLALTKNSPDWTEAKKFTRDVCAAMVRASAYRWFSMRRR